MTRVTSPLLPISSTAALSSLKITRARWTILGRLVPLSAPSCTVTSIRGTLPSGASTAA